MTQDTTNKETTNTNNNNNNDYTPPKVWQPVEGNGGKFAGTNKPTAGARHK